VADFVVSAAQVVVQRTEEAVDPEAPAVAATAPEKERGIFFRELFRPAMVKRGEETCPSFFWRNHETFPGRAGGAGALEETRTGNRGC